LRSDWIEEPLGCLSAGVCRRARTHTRGKPHVKLCAESLKKGSYSAPLDTTSLLNLQIIKHENAGPGTRVSEQTNDEKQNAKRTRALHTQGPGPAVNGLHGRALATYGWNQPHTLRATVPTMPSHAQMSFYAHASCRLMIPCIGHITASSHTRHKPA
jgi:hypothetical protein